MKTSSLNLARLSGPFAAVFAALLSTSHAQTIWDGGGGGTTSIDLNANWNNNIVSPLDGSTAATFGTAGNTATINTDASFTGIIINRNANFTLANGAGSLTLGTGGITVNLPEVNNGRSHTISESNLILGDSQSWSVINNGGAYASLTVSSAISELNESGIAKFGGGTLILSGTNTYTGGTTISNGTLGFRNLASKASTGTHVFEAGTTLGIGYGPVSTTHFSATDITNAFAGNMTGNLSNISVDETTNIGIDTTQGSLSYASAIGSIPRGLTKLGTNTLTLNIINAYTGVTTLEGGTLTFNTLANAGTDSSIGNFATAGASGLVLRGGTLNYTGASVITDRGFTTSGPSLNTIQVGGNVNLALGDSIRNDTVNSGTSGLNFAATGAGSSITISKLSTGSSISALDFGFSGTDVTATINNLEIFGPRTVVRRTGSGILNLGNVTGSISGSNSNNTWFGSTVITGAIFGLTGDLFFQDTVNVSGVSSFNARISLRGLNNTTSSILTFNSIKDVGLASSLGAPLTAERGTIIFGTFDRQATMRYNGTGDTTNRVIQLASRTGTILTMEQAGTGLLKFTSNFTLGDSTINGSFASRTLRLTGSTSGSGEIAGIIPEWNAATNRTDVEKTGTGTWTLSGANTYTGSTTVNGGTLALGANNVISDVSAIMIGAGTLDAATFTDTLGTLDVSASSAKINLGSGAALAFADSSAIDWTGGSLDIIGTFVSGASIKFGSSSAALTPTQLGLITVNGAGAGTFSLDSSGFLVSASSAYDTWKAANAPGSNPHDDTDGDGVPNAVEFVLGGTSLTKDLSKMPVLSTSGANMTFTFQRAVSSIDPKTAVTIETSTDLVTWNTAPSPYTVPDTAVANNPGVTIVEDTSLGFDTVTLTVPQAPDTKKFARLKVVITP